MRGIQRIDRGFVYEYPPKAFTLSWQMTEWCNYRCHYCYQNGSVRKWIPYEEICETADKLNQWFNNLKCNISLHLVGGEVTYYDLIDLLNNHLTSNYLKKIILITNLSRDLNYFTSLFEVIKSRGMDLTLVASFHEDYMEQNKDFFDKAKALNAKINVVISDKNANLLDAIFTELEDNEFNLGRVELVKDQSGISNITKDIYMKWLPKVSKNISTFYVTFDDGEEELLSRSQCISIMTNFYGYKCRRYLKLYKDTVHSGSCRVIGPMVQLDEIINYTPAQVADLCTVDCTAYKCPFCTFSAIWK